MTRTNTLAGLSEVSDDDNKYSGKLSEVSDGKNEK
jgi:hypothetical protein